MSRNSTRGENLMSKGYLTSEQLDQAQRRHRETPQLSLEEICLQMGFLTEETFRKAVAANGERPRLGSLLIREGLVTENQLARALALQRRTGGLLGQILVRMGCVGEDKLVEVLAAQYHLPFVPVGNLRPEKALRRVLNATYALHHGVVPVALMGRRLTVAVSDPTYRKPVEELASLTGYEVDVVLTTHAQVERLRSFLYGDGEEEEETADGAAHAAVEDAGSASPPKPVSQPASGVDGLITALLKKAVEEGATAIHLDPGEQGPKLAFRVEGQLQDFGSGDLGSQVVLYYRAVVQKLKSLARMDVAERRKPQQGTFRAERTSDETTRSAAFHLTVLPSLYGDALTLRVAEGGNPTRGMSSLGFSDDVAVGIQEVLQSPHGIFLVTGPAASGKSSTLWACAESLFKSGRKVVALTTHPSFTLPDVVHMDVGSESAGDLASWLELVESSDPDVVLLDEIRSPETASWVVEWARSGRAALVSMRSLGARSAMAYLRTVCPDVGLFRDHLSAILGQRLVRCLCPECAVDARPDARVQQLLGATLDPRAAWRTGSGCGACGHSGYQGRLPIAELWIQRSQPGGIEAAWMGRRAEDSKGRVWISRRQSREDLLWSFQECVSQVRDAACWIGQGRTTGEEILRSFSAWELEASAHRSRRTDDVTADGARILKAA